MPRFTGKIFRASLLTQASLAFGEASFASRANVDNREREHREVRFAHERRVREKKPVRLELRRHKNLFDLTLTKNREQIIPLERRTLFSLWRLPSLLGGRWTVDRQRCFEQRPASSPLLSVQRPAKSGSSSDQRFFCPTKSASPYVAGVARLFLRQISIFQTLRLDRFFSKRQRIWG